MLSFKIIGVILILSGGLYFSLDVKRKYDKRIEMLEQFSKDFNFIINEISFLKTPVDEIFKKLKGDVYRYIPDYYRLLSEDKLKEIFSEYSLALKKEDVRVILDFFKCLGVHDYNNQINSLNAYSELLNMSIEEAKKDKEKNQKPKAAITICSFIVIIIFLI